MMFFRYLGRYFAVPPKLSPLPLGAVCPICGDASAQLWRSNAGSAQCIVQCTITRKRLGRKSHDDSCVSGSDRSGMHSFSLGSLAVCGPSIAEATTRVVPDISLPEHISIEYPEGGSSTRFVTRLILAPPEPPFVAIIFGRKASFRCAVTFDRSLIRINGPEPWDVAPATVHSWATLLQGMRTNDVCRLLALRMRIARGESSDLDRKWLDGLLGEHPDIVPALRMLPTPGTPHAQILQRILAR